MKILRPKAGKYPDPTPAQQTQADLNESPHPEVEK